MLGTGAARPCRRHLRCQARPRGCRTMGASSTTLTVSVRRRCPTAITATTTRPAKLLHLPPRLPRASASTPPCGLPLVPTTVPPTAATSTCTCGWVSPCDLARVGVCAFVCVCAVYLTLLSCRRFVSPICRICGLPPAVCDRTPYGSDAVCIFFEPGTSPASCISTERTPCIVEDDDSANWHSRCVLLRCPSDCVCVCARARILCACVWVRENCTHRAHTYTHAHTHTRTHTHHTHTHAHTPHAHARTHTHTHTCCGRRGSQRGGRRTGECAHERDGARGPEAGRPTLAVDDCDWALFHHHRQRPLRAGLAPTWKLPTLTARSTHCSFNVNVHSIRRSTSARLAIPACFSPLLRLRSDEKVCCAT